MRLAFSSLLIVAALCARGQSFTNGTVFNYSVGDTIFLETKVLSDPGPPQRIYQVIQSKTIAAASDTITYSVQVTRHTSPTINTPGSSTTTVETWNITGLTDTVKIQLPSSDCIHFKTIDTTDYCGLPARIVQSVTDAFPCPEGYHQYKIIEGLGVFTYSSTITSGQNVGYSYTLKAAHKTGNSCGVVGHIPTGLDEMQSPLQLEVYPNPSDGAVFINCPGGAEITLHDSQGKLVRRFDAGRGKRLLHLDIEAGIYLLRATNNQATVYKKLLVTD